MQRNWRIGRKRIANIANLNFMSFEKDMCELREKDLKFVFALHEHPATKSYDVALVINSGKKRKIFEFEEVMKETYEVNPDTTKALLELMALKGDLEVDFDWDDAEVLEINPKMHFKFTIKYDVRGTKYENFFRGHIFETELYFKVEFDELRDDFYELISAEIPAREAV